MKKLKFLLSAIICLCYSASTFAHDLEVGHIYYNVDLENRTVTVTYGDTQYSGHVTIPDMILFKGREFLVTAIGDEAFHDCDNLTSVKIGNCVESIGWYAFYGCDKLETVKMGPKIKSIESSAFDDCVSLSSIDIPNEVVSIGNYAFDQCYNLKSATLGKSVKYIGESAFNHCWKLTSITLPSNVQEIGTYAFCACSELRDVRFEDGEENLTIEENVFTSSGIKTLYLGRNITYANAFKDLDDLQNVEVGNLVTKIPYNTFYSCSSLNSVVLPESLTEIGANAFQYCESLNSVTIPANVKTIGESAFFGCKNLSAIHALPMLPPSNTDNKECFDDRIYLNATLHVAENRKSAYSNASLWKKFFTIVEPGDEYFDNMSILNIEANEGGTVRFKEFEIKNQTIYHEFAKNEFVTFSFEANDGWKLKTVTLNGEDITEMITNGTYTVQMKEDYSIVVKFEQVPAYLTVQHAENGSVSQLVERYQSYKLVINPSEKWKINTVSFNGEDVTEKVGADHSFTTPMITENAILNVSFELDSSSAVEEMSNSNISIHAYNGAIIIKGADFGDTITVYTVDGSEIKRTIASGRPQNIHVPANQVYIVKVNNRTFKVSL